MAARLVDSRVYGAERHSLARVVIDESAVEIAERRVVLQRIYSALEAIPARDREYIANTLLAQAALIVTSGVRRC